VPSHRLGSFGETPEAMATFINEMAQIVDAVVLLPSNLVPAEADEAALKSALETLVTLTGEVPLGVYEVPAPYHRVVTPETLAYGGDRAVRVHEGHLAAERPDHRQD